MLCHIQLETYCVSEDAMLQLVSLLSSHAGASCSLLRFGPCPLARSILSPDGFFKSVVQPATHLHLHADTPRHQQHGRIPRIPLASPPETWARRTPPSARNARPTVSLCTTTQTAPLSNRLLRVLRRPSPFRPTLHRSRTKKNRVLRFTCGCELGASACVECEYVDGCDGSWLTTRGALQGSPDEAGCTAGCTHVRCTQDRCGCRYYGYLPPALSTTQGRLRPAHSLDCTYVLGYRNKSLPACRCTE